MVQYTENDEHRARNIVDALLSEKRDLFDLDSQLSIFDIERDVSEFRDDLDFLSRIGADVPALRISDEGAVPVSLSLLGFDEFPFRYSLFDIRRLRPHRPFFRDFIDDYYRVWRDYFRELGDRDELFAELETISHEEARSSFLRRATDFLATRIAAIRSFLNGEARASSEATPLKILQRFGGARISTPGCLFLVSSNSAGLRVFWSGAYYVSPNYFGNPTSPVVGVLQSGTYIFGVDGGAYGNFVQWDTSAVCSLPGKPSLHLNY